MKKRITGKVREIEKGKLYKITIYLGKDPITGIPKRKTHDFKGNKSEANQYLKDWIDELENPPFEASDKLLGDYLLEWVDTYAKPDLERTTYQAYRKEITRHMIPILGHIPLCYLTPLNIQEYYSFLSEGGKLKKTKDKDGKIIYERGEGLSNRAVTYQHAILRQALEKAVDLELIAKNPCDKAKPPKGKKRPGQAWVPMTAEELKSYLKGCEGDRDYAIIYTAAYTGARQSELLGLQWADILWDKKLIRIHQALHQTEDEDRFEHRSRTKNQTSTRDVAVTDEVLEVLKAHRKQQAELQLASGGKFKNINKLVFPDIRNGGFETRQNLHHRFDDNNHKFNRLKEHREAAGIDIEIVAKTLNISTAYVEDIENCQRRLTPKMAAKLSTLLEVTEESLYKHPGLTFHHLRHIHATILLSDGEYINAVSERLGHKDVFTTLRTYAHVLPNRQGEVALHFSKLMGGNSVQI